MSPSLLRLILYTKRMPEMIDFYGAHFGYTARHIPNDRIVELLPPGNGAVLLLHPAAKSQKEGQVLVKLVFDVEDVAEFCAAARLKGLGFGALHRGDGYIFANAKDPSGNNICVSSRAFASRA
ncbi:MAG TPA: VOC family protein [Asticcacaulis sp.]|nr:VOC family protein [Asticcacaulis sp.]